MAGRIEEVRASSWADLLAHLYADALNPALGRFRSPYVFRGEGDASFTLETSLARLGGSYARVEAHLLRDLRKYAPRGAAPVDSVWNWLAVGQHYGLPTRLLDWTYSPYVALHVATRALDTFDRDGVIWCVSYPKTNEALPDRLRSLLAAEEVGVFSAELLAQAADSLAAFGRLAEQPFVAFFEPPSLDERIVNQFALFSLPSDPGLRVDHWLAGAAGRARRIILPAELKWEVRDKLDQGNITERVLFPGLDGLCSWLKRYYGPKTP